jgi:hypothetical protein
MRAAFVKAAGPVVTEKWSGGGGARTGGSIFTPVIHSHAQTGRVQPGRSAAKVRRP